MKKNLMILTLILIMLVSVPTFANDVEVMPVLISENIELTIDDLIELAKENDKHDVINDLKIEFEEDDLEDAQKLADLNDYGGGNRIQILIRMKIVNVDLYKAQADLKIAQMERDNYEYGITTDIYSKAYDVKLNEIMLEKEQVYLEYVEKKYSSDKVRYDMGLISILDLNNSQNTFQSQLIEELEAESALVSAENALKSEIGYDLDQELIFQMDFEKIPFERIYSDSLAEASSMKEINLYKTYVEYYTKDVTFDLTNEAYEPYDKEYKSAYYDSEIGRINYEDQYNSFLIGFKSDFNTLNILGIKIDIQDLYLEISEKNYEIGIQKYELGLISQQDLVLMKSTLITSQYNYYKSIKDYNMKIMDIEELIAN